MSTTTESGWTAEEKRRRSQTVVKRTYVAYVAVVVTLIGGLLGTALYDTHRETRERAEEREATRARAEAGDAQAQYALGRMHTCPGRNPRPDAAQALYWLRRAARTAGPVAGERATILADLVLAGGHDTCHWTSKGRTLVRDER